MLILRRYFDESEWESIDEETARKVLARFFLDVELALVDIAAGCVICTNAAEYKRQPVVSQPAERTRNVQGFADR